MPPFDGIYPSNYCNCEFTVTSDVELWQLYALLDTLGTAVICGAVWCGVVCVCFRLLGASVAGHLDRLAPVLATSDYSSMMFMWFFEQKKNISEN